MPLSVQKPPVSTMNVAFIIMNNKTMQPPYYGLWRSHDDALAAAALLLLALNVHGLGRVCARVGAAAG